MVVNPIYHVNTDIVINIIMYNNVNSILTNNFYHNIEDIMKKITKKQYYIFKNI